MIFPSNVSALTTDLLSDRSLQPVYAVKIIGTLLSVTGSGCCLNIGGLNFLPKTTKGYVLHETNQSFKGSATGEVPTNLLEVREKEAPLRIWIERFHNRGEQT